MTGKVPTLVREKIDGALIAEAEKTLGRKLKPSDLDLIEKTLGVKIDPASLGGGKGGSRKGAYKRGKSGDDFLNQLKKSYRGKISPADIEKARKLFKYNPKWNFENTILKDRKILEDDKKSI